MSEVNYGLSGFRGIGGGKIPNELTTAATPAASTELGDFLFLTMSGSQQWSAGDRIDFNANGSDYVAERPWSQSSYGTGVAYVGGASRWITVDADGYYLIEYKVECQTACSTAARLVNGSSPIDGTGDIVPGAGVCQWTGILRMKAGDGIYVTVLTGATGGAPFAVSSVHNRFRVQRLGAWA